MIWAQTAGKEFERTARKLATTLAADPGFDPLPWGEGIDNFVAQRLEGKRAGMVTMVQGQLNTFAFESGMIQKVEEEIKEVPSAALSAMAPLERDIYGFTNRNVQRLQLAGPYLADIARSRQRFVFYWMSRLETEETALTREARYATAIRKLVAHGEKWSSVAHSLGISTSVMDRLERENRANVELRPDDPILTELAPSLG